MSAGVQACQKDGKVAEPANWAANKIEIFWISPSKNRGLRSCGDGKPTLRKFELAEGGSTCSNLIRGPATSEICKATSASLRLSVKLTLAEGILGPLP